jgi:hypothetical protein
MFYAKCYSIKDAAKRLDERGAKDIWLDIATQDVWFGDLEDVKAKSMTLPFEFDQFVELSERELVRLAESVS